MIRVVGLIVAGKRNGGTMMEIIVPQCVQPVATFITVANELCLLRFVFGNKESRATAGRVTDAACNRRQNVILGSIKNLLRGVEAQTVEMKLVYPVTGVRDEELADWTAVVSIEIDGLAPFVNVTIGEIIG